MINIISDVSKESNSNKNYSNIEEINNDRMVDITQNKRCGIFCKTKAFLSTFILILCMALTGCGKQNNIVTDYGEQVKNASGEDGEAADTVIDTDNDTGNSGVNSVISSGASLREMVGTERFEWKDGFETNGVPVDIGVKCSVPDEPYINVYQVEKITMEELNDDEIVSALFGDTAVKLDELTAEPRQIRNIDDVCDMTSAYDNLSWRHEDERNGDKRVWIDGYDFYIHMYQGKRDGVDFYLLLSYEYVENEWTGELNGQRTILLSPVSISDYIGDEDYDSVMVYSCNPGSDMVEPDNRMEFSETMADDVGEFLKNNFKINAYKNIVSPNTGDAYPDTMNVEKSDLVFINGQAASYIESKHTIADEYGDYLDIDDDELYQLMAKDGFANGYELVFSGKLSGLFETMGDNEQYKLNNSGHVLVTDKGVMQVLFRQSMEVTDITENVQILDENKIKECFKDAVMNKIDKEKIGDRKKLYFDELYLSYYPVNNPNNEREYTCIPVWEFRTKPEKTNVGDVVQFVVYINAIDGSLVDAVELVH